MDHQAMARTIRSMGRILATGNNHQEQDMAVSLAVSQAMDKAMGSKDKAMGSNRNMAMHLQLATRCPVITP